MKCSNKTMLTTAALAVVYAMSALGADRVRIVNEGGIRDQWMLADGVKLAAPGYPAAFATRGDNVCVALGYSIKPDGTTSDFTLLKAWTSSTADKEPVQGFWDAFAQASAGAVSQWKFKPRPEISEARSTYTVATMHFMGKQATSVGELRDRCRISDLPTFVQNQKSNKYQRGTMEKNEMERLRRNQEAGGAMVANPGRR